MTRHQPISPRLVLSVCALLAGVLFLLLAYSLAPQKLPPPVPPTATLQVIVITATALAVTMAPPRPHWTVTPLPTERLPMVTSTRVPPTATPEPTETPVPPTETPERTPVQRG